MFADEIVVANVSESSALRDSVSASLMTSSCRLNNATLLEGNIVRVRTPELAGLGNHAFDDLRGRRRVMDYSGNACD
jgi:hypothetical protein